MASRYHVDSAQADRVEATALLFLAQVRDAWELGGEQVQLLLSWAARVHELGLDIAHAHYHRHGAYVLENADMPGFPREEQQVVACLVHAHRRKFERVVFQGLPRRWQRPAMRLAVLLRLAVLFHRSRTSDSLPDVRIRAKGRAVQLQIPSAWLEASPLTLADLDREREFLAEAEFDLAIQRRNPAMAPKDR
jgi:exopolyphosphatase / guanosine-5'-triphosphate,3'-diphosphate pyrophosphatase